MAKWNEPVHVDLPAEYAGSKLGGVRTARDIMLTVDEMVAWKERTAKEAVEKAEKKFKERGQKAVKMMLSFIILSHLLMLCEYLFFWRYVL